MTQARNLSRLLNKKLQTYKFTATSGQTSFADSDDGGNILSYTPDNMLVTYNGVVLENGSEYTATNGTSVVLGTGADSAAEVNVYAFESVSLGGYLASDKGIDDNASSTALTIDVSGNVGIGTTSPIDTFHAVGSDGATSRTTYQGATEFIFENNGDFSIDLSTGNADQAYINWHDTDAVQQGWLSYNHNGDYMRFGTNGSERMRIDSNGNVGIGGVFSSETIDATLHVASSTAGIRIEDTNNGIGGTAYTPKLTFDANGDEVGSIGYVAGNLDITTENINGSDIRFFTGGSQRMSLTTSGYLRLGTTSPTAGTHPTLTVHGDATRVTFELYRPATGTSNDLQTWRSDIGGTSTKVADVEANGDFNSATGNYATLSDERLKQDITPANSQWDDIKALEFKNYRMINLVETMGDDAPVYFGVIAQQLEAAGMNGLVEDKVDDDTQEVTKVVKTSILQMKAVKALQEAMERIEALEAEVAALKGGA